MHVLYAVVVQALVPAERLVPLEALTGDKSKVLLPQLWHVSHEVTTRRVLDQCLDC